VAKEIKVKIVVDDDGSLKVVAGEATKASKATDKLDKSGKRLNKTRGNFHKLEKGTAGLTNNSTKAFSKQAQTIGGGSSGLVGAYATLAANVFALTAAFGALSRAAAVSKLEEGLMFTGRAAGANLKIVSDQLVEMTGNAVSAAEAMKSVAVGISAGFSEDQMKGLTDVASGASKALGRDMADALDRLTRGAAKLEPEILDELGIMVRLDEVTQKYADSVGKTTGEVTSFEKRMAFTNAIIEQGTRKFGALNEAIEPDAFSKLRATFDDLVKSIFNTINGIAIPAIQLLADNTHALFGLMAMFGAGLAKSMVPGLGAMAAKSLAAAKGTTVLSKAQLKGFRVNKNMSMENRKNAKAMDMGNKSRSLMIKSLDTANATIAANTIQMKANLAAKEVDTVTFATNTTMIRGATLARKDLTRAITSQNIALLQNYTAKSLAMIADGDIIKGLKLYGRGIRKAFQRTRNLNKGFGTLRMGAAMLTTSIKVLGGAFLNLIPIFGQIFFAASLLFPYLKKLFNKAAGKEETSEAVKRLNERMAEYPNILAQYSNTLEDSETITDKFNASLEVTIGLTDQLTASIKDLRDEEKGRMLDQAKQAELRAADLQSQIIGKQQEYDAKSGNVRRGISNKIRELREQRDAALNTAKLARSLATSGFQSKGLKDNQLATAKNMLAILQQKLDAGASGLAAETITKKMELLNQVIANGGKISDEWVEKYKNIGIALKNEKEKIKNTTDLMQKLNKEQTKLFEADPKKTRFDKLMEARLNVEKNIAGASKTKGEFGTSAFDEALKNAGMTAKEFSDFQSNNTKGRFALASLKSAKANIDLATAAEAKYSSMAKNSFIFTSLQVEAQKQVLMYKKDEVESEIALMEATGAKEKNIEKYNELLAEQLILQNKLKAHEISGTKTRVQSIVDQTGITGFGNIGAYEVGENALNIAPMGLQGGTTEKISQLGEILRPMIKDLESLGPEGKTMATAISGVVSFADTVIMSFDEKIIPAFEKFEMNADGCFERVNQSFKDLSFEDKMSVIAGGLQIAAAMVNMLGQTYSMYTQQRLKEIDREIAAEKKRDGKSVESRRKIEALEKKKERQKKKAFEMDKKIKMAQAIINTALAATLVMATIPMPFSAPIAAAVIAMGMAQIAIISKMKYDGGDTTAPPTPTASVGERNPTVDLAQSSSAVGELGYARGEEGVGNAQNFKPAFSGARYRAAGGSVGYVVGEQGPELFMPDTPGTIVPADDTAEATAPASNVNINISAIDAAGVEDVLLSQRGNIIAMIRESANQVGDTFLEKVDTISEGATR
jgi:hypothetical protein